MKIEKGTRFGRLIVVEDIAYKQVSCLCDCGTRKDFPRDRLRSGTTKSCGCLKSDLLRDRWEKRSKATELIQGQIFGRLTVLQTNRQKVQVRCLCGKEFWGSKYDIRSGRTKSCGCYNAEIAAKNMRNASTKHGLWGTRTWRCWQSMLARCFDPKALGYESYGGRGILVCNRWTGEHGLVTLVDDLGEAPSDYHTLDRIDSTKNYEPGNVRWGNPKDQARNRTSNRNLSAFGKTQCLAAWAEETGIKNATIAARLQRGWTPEQTLTEKVQTQKTQATHSVSKERRSWHALNHRSQTGYVGVSVCDAWKGQGRGNTRANEKAFQAFLAHIGQAPSDKHTVDRIDNNRGYEPGNVRWATPKEQGRNRCTNVTIVAWGRTQNLSAWAEETGLSGTRILGKLAKGMSPEEALTSKKTTRKGLFS